MISYEKFKELMQMIEDHIFLHSPEIQEQIRQSEEDIKAGRYAKAKGSEIDKLLAWLYIDDLDLRYAEVHDCLE